MRWLDRLNVDLKEISVQVVGAQRSNDGLMLEEKNIYVHIFVYVRVRFPPLPPPLPTQRQAAHYQERFDKSAG